MARMIPRDRFVSRPTGSASASDCPVARWVSSSNRYDVARKLDDRTPGNNRSRAKSKASAYLVCDPSTKDILALRSTSNAIWSRRFNSSVDSRENGRANKNTTSKNAVARRITKTARCVVLTARRNENAKRTSSPIAASAPHQRTVTFSKPNLLIVVSRVPQSRSQ